MDEITKQKTLYQEQERQGQFPTGRKSTPALSLVEKLDNLQHQYNEMKGLAERLDKLEKLVRG